MAQSTLLRTMLASLAIPAAAGAADSDSRYVIWGPGEASCNSYNHARAANDFDHFKTYTMGYLTAYNAVVPDTYSITHSMDMNAITAWLDGFCQDHQIEGFAGALHQLVEEMKDKREQHGPQGGAHWP
ncbi:MAG: hypothetical protein ACT4NU_11650 [Chromatiales bacterium]